MNSDKIVVTPPQRKAIGIAIVFALLGGALFLKPYFSLIIVSIILAYLFSPVYRWFLNRSNNTGRSASLTFLVASLMIIIPVIFVIILSVKQIDSLLSSTDFTAFNESLADLIDQFNSLVNSSLIQIDTAQVTQYIEDTLKALGESLIGSIPALFGGFLAFITSAIIFIYVFLSLLKHNEKLVQLVNVINPLGEEISKLYVSKMSAMTKATVRGQFIIALCQGLESAIVLSIAGLSDLFFFFLVLLTALSVVPMGAGIVTIPIGVIMILTGNVWQGALIILNHLIIVTNIDNVLRPRLVPKEARLDPALMILAVFAGVAYYGFMGIVLGPVIMIVVVTTIEVYLEVYRDIEMDKSISFASKSKGVLNRVGSKAQTILGKKSKTTKSTADSVENS